MINGIPTSNQSKPFLAPVRPCRPSALSRGLLWWHALVDGDLQALPGDATLTVLESQDIDGHVWGHHWGYIYIWIYLYIYIWIYNENMDIYIYIYVYIYIYNEKMDETGKFNYGNLWKMVNVYSLRTGESLFVGKSTN